MTTAVLTPDVLASRLWSKVDKNGPLSDYRPDLGPCWLWTAASQVRGYGMLGRPAGTGSRLAHRIAYEMEHGPVPDGLELDHLCRRPSCVRPSHLEPVPHLVNVQRGVSGQRQRARTHCPRGHPYDEANTAYFGPDRKWRDCRACSRAKMRRRRAAQRKVAA